MIGKLSFLSFILLSMAGNPKTDSCVDWFKKSTIDPKDKNCLSKCVSLQTGMDTFLCPRACAKFCHTVLTKELIMDFTYYPGLNKVEKALIAEYPKEAIVVFKQMNISEGLTLKNFKRSAQQDESDAFRHFVWAGLMVRELGPDLAQKFLDAHEAEPTSFVEERAMDLANNRAGILEAERLKKIGKLTLETIDQKGIEALKQNKLVVLKPRGGVP